jgi:GDP-L-fucose synthase
MSNASANFAADAELPFALAGRRVFVAGHGGMVGSAILRRLASERCEIVTADRRTVDLTRQTETESFMAATRPDVVIIAAAKVGGISANASLPVEFVKYNQAIAHKKIASAHAAKVRKLLFLGSSCIYPKLAAQPINEDELLTGPLEPTNEWYAIAKIAGIKLCQAYRRQFDDDFISIMPTNLYGPGDNYHPEYSHVPAALISRLHEAKVAGHREVTIWGTGRPRREFLYVDDLADACVFVLKQYSGDEHLNVGTGEDVSIAEFASLIAKVVGYEGKFEYDTTRPDGTLRKLLDVSRLEALGWKAETELSDGLAKAYADFVVNRRCHSAA